MLVSTGEMLLIIIYGPPGVGKLTVAKELSKLTGYNIFHNHLTFDLVHSVIKHPHPKFWGTVEKYRYELVELGAKEKIPGLIHTCVYAHPVDLKYMRELIKRVEKHKGRVKFVRLYCDRPELHKRIKNPSRKKFFKLNTLKGLKAVEEKYELFGVYPHRKALEINTTKLSPKETAKKIAEELRLT